MEIISRLEKSKKESIDEIELRCFFGILLHLGYVKKNDVEIDRIWSPSDSQHSDLASAAMSRSRFQIISTHICFDNMNTRLERCLQSKMYKIEDIFNVFRQNIQSAVCPGANLCVDETLYSYRGRCPIKQFIPSKPAKYGIKIWSLVDNDTKYLLDAVVYQGKEPNAERTAKVRKKVHLLIFLFNVKIMHVFSNV